MTRVLPGPGPAGVDDCKDRAPACLLRQALFLGLRIGAPALADLLRARSRGEVPERAACPARRDYPGPDGQRPGGRTGRGCEEAAGKAGRGTLVDAEPARPAAHRECGDDNPRDRADGRSPLRPPECHPSFLQRGAGGQDLRVRGLRAGWPGEPRAPAARHWKFAVQPGSGAGEGRERQRGGRPGRQMVRCTTGRCSCRWIWERFVR